MRILIRSYDVNDRASGPSLHALRQQLSRMSSHDVWATDEVLTLNRVRGWSPDVIITRQWATEEASRWATALSLPLIMFVHGPGQFEHFMPQCDLVVFDSEEIQQRTAAVLGNTPHVLAGANDCDRLARLVEDIGQSGRRKPTLALCMTVCNEASTLEKAIDSVSAIVDEIILGVDMRSTDGTSAIARRRTPDSFAFTESSPPDFPRMRNRAMERVRSDWALVLDGHEWLEHAELVPQALETTAWSIEVETLFEPDEKRVPGLIFPFARIHRRHVRFCGAAAHEEVNVSPERRDSCRQIRIWHERKPGRAADNRAREKQSGELALLRKAWQENGDRRALFYLANGLRECGKHLKAIACYRAYLQAPNFAEEGWQARLFLARCHAAIAGWAQAQELFGQCVMQYPERAEAAVGLGHMLLRLGQARTAAAWFRHATAQPLPRRFRLFVEVPAYTWQGWHGLALALEALGDPAGAINAEQLALDGGAGPWAESNIAMWKANAAASAA